MPDTVLFRGQKFNIVREEKSGWDILRHLGSVAILPVSQQPFSPEAEVWLCDQYRPALGRNLIEIPAGICDVEGEDYRRGAVRELIEELGVWPERIARLGMIHPSAGYTTESVTIFIGSNLKAVNANPEMRPYKMTVVQMLRAIQDGIITDAKTIAALLMWERCEFTWEPSPVVD
jgi:ADP-ribose pyrophosphatase